jgi:resuscitation-promoting factor RpfB
MDGNSSERGRHRHRAHPNEPVAAGDPQWTPPSDDRPQWTPSEPWVPEQRSWFDAPVTPQEPPARAPEVPARAPEGPDPDATASWSAPLVGPDSLDPAAGVPRTGPDPEATQLWSPMAGGFRPAVGRGEGPATETWRAADWDQAGNRPAPGAPPAWNGDPHHTGYAGHGGDAHGGYAGHGGDAHGGAQPGGDAHHGGHAGHGGYAGHGGDAHHGDGAQFDRGTERAWNAAAPGGATRWDAPAGGPPAAGKKHAVKHPIRLALFALVLFGLVAGSAAWMSMDKEVRLTVDGEARAVSTYASTVGGVLDDAEVTVGEHDTLAPGREAKVSDGDEIVLRRGRLLTLTVDGKPKQVWVTATTVEEALSQVGMRQNGLFVSANRSERLPLEGYQLELRTPKKVMIVADGKKFRLTTTAPTVGAAMEEAAVTVDADDKVSQLAAAPVRGGMVVTVTRVETRTTTTRTVIEYKTVEKEDPKAEPGSEKVETKGVNGLQEITRVETYVDGKLTTSKVAKVTVVTKPVDEVTVVGPEPPPVQAEGCEAYPTTGGLNWCGLAQCESGLNPNAYNPAGPYYGLYQFDQGTWTSSGGAGSPAGKSIAEQTRVAYNLYQARGASPWPVCGRQL